MTQPGGRVLLLGGTSDIGLATVRQLRPDSVVLAGRDLVRISAVADDLRREFPGLYVEQRPFDATDLSAAQAVVAEAFAEGPIDVVLPAFGVLGDQQRAEDEPQHAAEILQVNLVAQAVVLLEAAKHLRAQGRGTLVVFSSIAAVRGRRANFVYGASKAGLDALGSGLAMALDGSGANVLVVRPGFVIGSMTAGMSKAPLSSTPDQVAVALVRALRAGQRTVWVPRPLVAFAWLLRLLPYGAVRRLPR